MNKRKLASRAAEILRQNDIRKSVPTQKAVIHVSDDDGNQSNFTIRKPGRGVLFNLHDVESVLDACLAAVEESLKRGEHVYIHGYGEIGMKYRAPRRTKIPATGEWVEIGGHWLPRICFGKKLKMAVKVYEMNMGGNGTDDEEDDADYSDDISESYEDDGDGE